jgi:hypothetical protein
VPEIELVKTTAGKLRGFTEEDEKGRVRYKRFVDELEPGEFFTLVYKKPRDSVRHRRFMKMLRLGFEHWEPERGRKRLTYKGKPIEKDFEKFREEITILAGFYHAKYDLDGKVTLEAQSIAFDKMEDDDFERLYKAVKTVLIEHVLLQCHYTPETVDAVLEQMERF